MIAWMKKVNNFQIAKFQPLGAAYLLLDFLPISAWCFPANISTLFQRCLLVYATSRRGTTSNQRWNDVVYFNVEIYNVEQRRINVVYFNADMSNVRQRQNNVVIFNGELHNVGKCWNNVVKMTIFKKNKKIISNRIHGIQSFNYYFIIFFTLLPMLWGICLRVIVKPWKFLQDHEKYCIAKT